MSDSINAIPQDMTAFVKERVLKGFGFKDNPDVLREYGDGHINDTFLLEYAGERDGYILQRINTAVFKEPLALMGNIMSVTGYLREVIIKNGGDPRKETMNIVPAADGKSYFIDDTGGFWRSYLFIGNTLCYSAVLEPKLFYESGRGFGNFQKLLADYPVNNLVESIPDFHNTAKRFEAFKDAVSEDIAGRAASCGEAIAFAMEREAGAGLHVDMLKRGAFPLRVTHNDTKLNNVLFDADTNRAVCLVDLDTVMPGLSVNDFGDAIRFGANTAAEDERDLSKVSLSLELFEAFAAGFIEGSGGILTPEETGQLAQAARLMTFECGLRFLTDYLRGDAYFKIHRPGHNLERALNQFALVKDIEGKLTRMEGIVKRLVTAK